MFLFLLALTFEVSAIDRQSKKDIVSKESIEPVASAQIWANEDTSDVPVDEQTLEKINLLIDQTSMDDSTKEQVKSIVSDTPEAAREVGEIVRIIKGKDDYASKLEFWMYLLGAVITFLTFLAGLVKKIRALPYYFSSIYWFEKLTGKNKAQLNGEKGTYKKIFVPDGADIKIVRSAS